MEFKPVVLKNLKTIDVQHPDNGVLPMDPGVVVFHLDDVIDPSHNPAEQTLVHGLGTATIVNLNKGVLQGSVLGSLWFTLYINDTKVETFKVIIFCRTP